MDRVRLHSKTLKFQSTILFFVFVMAQKWQLFYVPLNTTPIPGVIYHSFLQWHQQNNKFRVISPHGHIAPINDHRPEASSGVSVWIRLEGMAGGGAGLGGTAASGDQLWAGCGASLGSSVVAAAVAGLDQLLQDIIGLGVVAQALQHAQDVTMGVAELEEALHFAVLVVHTGSVGVSGLNQCLVYSRCSSSSFLSGLSVWSGNPRRLLILSHHPSPQQPPVVE